ncbi:MAG TPA: riboflavin synthase [Acidobacteriota bacterium]|nr:riboflavin synthase [Acidobacteriota bacterium]
MFTGIIQTTGSLQEKQQTADGATLRIQAPEVIPELRPGDSISVDGVCLTVKQLLADCLLVEASLETLRRSNLGDAEAGWSVNLELPVRPTEFLGGHLVQGHVDATGTVRRIREEGNSWIFSIEAPEQVLRYCVLKGSIAVNGISLTISGLSSTAFEVTIIPHTYEVTNLSRMVEGARVNLESDVISKYVENHLRWFIDRDPAVQGTRRLGNQS